MSPTSPRDAEIAYDVALRLTREDQRPERHRGPVDQHALGDAARGLRTRQIAFSVRSIVSISASALTTSAIRPTVPSRLARIENCVDRAQHRPGDAVGHQRLQEVASAARPGSVANIGNAENTASITVTSGTSEMMRGEGQAAGGEAEPVLAEALAQRVQRSSSQGQVCSVCDQRCGRCSSGPVTGRGERFIAGIIASDESTPPLRPPPCAARARWRSPASLALIVLGLAWELWLAPTGSGTLALKVLPLAAAAGRAAAQPHVHLPLGSACWSGSTSPKAWCARPASAALGALLAIESRSLLCAACCFVACAAHVPLARCAP